MDLTNCEFPKVYAIAAKGTPNDILKEISGLTEVVKELPLIIVNKSGLVPELTITGSKDYVQIEPKHSVEEIAKVQIENGHKVYLDFVSETSYRLRYKGSVIDIEKMNEQGILNRKISELERKLREKTSP